MLFLIFLFLDKHIHFLWCYFAFVSLRLFSGGIHCNTYWSCFAVSLFSFLIFIFVPELINFNSKILFQSLALSVISPLVFSPVLPKVRKIKKRKKKNNSAIKNIFSDNNYDVDRIVLLCD